MPLGAWGFKSPLGHQFAAHVPHLTYPCGLAPIPADARPSEAWTSARVRLQQRADSTVSMNLTAAFGILAPLATSIAGTFIQELAKTSTRALCRRCMPRNESRSLNETARAYPAGRPDDWHPRGVRNADSGAGVDRRHDDGRLHRQWKHRRHRGAEGRRRRVRRGAEQLARAADPQGPGGGVGAARPGGHPGRGRGSGRPGGGEHPTAGLPGGARAAARRQAGPRHDQLHPAARRTDTGARWLPVQQRGTPAGVVPGDRQGASVGRAGRAGQ